MIVNTARGSVIDEGALSRALRNGTVGGAALDVFSVEPLPLDHPFQSMENVILTPHVAAGWFFSGTPGKRNASAPAQAKLSL